MRDAREFLHQSSVYGAVAECRELPEDRGQQKKSG